MITIDYSGTHQGVLQAVQRANALLKDNSFFGQIAAHPAFDLSTATPVQVADILKNSTFRMEIQFYKTRNPWSDALAYDDPYHPLIIHLNERRLNRSLASICATIIHEAVHAADAMEKQFSFGHGNNNPAGKQNTAPYWIDGLAYTTVSGGKAAAVVRQHDLLANDTPPEDIAGIKFSHLRHCIGILGLALPSLVVLHCKLFGNCNALQDSISHYYFTIAAPWFVGILWGLGLALIFYPMPRSGSVPINTCKWGICRVFKPKLDATLTTISGLCALIVSLVPTLSGSTDSCAIFCFRDNAWRAGIHYSSAGLMLLIFSYMSICIFTRTNDPNWRKNKWKVRRNNVYIWSGVLTFLSIVSIGVCAILENVCKVPVYTKYTYWLEVSALVPFGLSWLVKGGFILTDDDDPSTLQHAKSLVTRGKMAT